jgi:hypothetical protein
VSIPGTAFSAKFGSGVRIRCPGQRLSADHMNTASAAYACEYTQHRAAQFVIATADS